MADTVASPKPNPAGAEKPPSAPPQPAIDLQAYLVWLRQMVLLLAFAAAGIAVVAARWANRPWLSTVQSACLAALATAAIGIVLGRILLQQARLATERPEGSQ